MRPLDIVSMEDYMCKAMLPLKPQHAAEAAEATETANTCVLTCNLSFSVYPYQYPTNAIWWSKGGNLLHLAKVGPNV